MTLIQRIHQFANMTWPQDIQGQQRYFAQVRPEAEARLQEALWDEFGEAELTTLRDLLTDMLPEEEDDDEG